MIGSTTNHEERPMEPTLSNLLCPEDSVGASTECVYLIPSRNSWAKSLHKTMSSVPSGGFYLILYEKPWRRVVRGLMAGRIILRGPTYTVLSSRMQEMGFTVLVRYAIWPNAFAPRIAYPYKVSNVARYLQWAGLIGGGRVFLLKMLGRILPIAWTHVLFPAEALIVRRIKLDKNEHTRQNNW